MKSRFIDQKNPRRALIQASGTPITNTLGEMYTLLRFQAPDALFERGVHEFDAWASAFGDTRIELELQPSGTYKPVERFCEFINVPELIDMFRSVADVVLKDDLRFCLTLPRDQGRPAAADHRSKPARHSVTTSRPWPSGSKRSRTAQRRVQKGDDILLSVITDGRHSAIDMRLVWPGNDNEPDNKLNKLIANVHRIWLETAGQPLQTARRHAVSDPGRRAADLLRPRDDQRRSETRLLRLPLDQAGTRAARHPGRARSPSCRTSSARPTSSACSTSSTPAACAS